MKPSEFFRNLDKRPDKSLGQNFLVDDTVVRDMVEAAQVDEKDVVVEVGPGLGALTQLLSSKAKQVLAIETDQELVNYLRDHTAKNVKIIHGDALRVDWTVTIKDSYKIVANIPYSITSPLLRKTFQFEKKPSVIVLLVQKEMAERIVAEPGSSERGFLTLLVEANATAKKNRTVKPGCFYPSPQTDSSIITLIPLKESKMEQIFWPAVEAGFRHRRQILANSLNKDLNIPKDRSIQLIVDAGLNPLCRPQELSFEAWVKLAVGLKKELV